MQLPKYNEMYNALLTFLYDGCVKTNVESAEYIAVHFNLSEKEKNLSLPSGRTYVRDRTSWAATYLKKAGLVISAGRGKYQITEEGRKVISSGVKIDNDYLMKYQTFADFCGRQVISATPKVNLNSDTSELSPKEKIADAIKELNSALADDLMAEVMRISPYDFEKLIIKLLVSMGYGSMLDNEEAVTPQSGDEGIDGVLTADKLGFDSIYIQAKQWKKDSCVGRPEIQKFVGAMAGQGAIKGLFITTAKFSKEARDYAGKNLTSKIVLIDGEDLAKLMIEYDLGVSTEVVYKLKKVDYDFFSEE